MTELVTVIRTKLRCHILLAERGPCRAPRGGGRDREFLYSNCGRDNRSRQTVVSLCNSNSSQKVCRTQLYFQSQKCWTGLEYQRPRGSNVNILWRRGEERRGEKPVKRLNNNTLVSPESASCSLPTPAQSYSNLLKC